MNHPNNPAGRLHLLLTEGKKKADNISTKKIWAELLDVDPNDNSLLLRRIGKVIDLPAQIREQIKEDKEIVDHERYLKGISNIENILLQFAFSRPWKFFKEQINDTTLQSLDICDEILSRKRPDKSVKQEELKVIHDDVRQLFNEVFESDLDEELRKFILEHLKQIDLAIQEFKISGTKPLEVAFQAAVGDRVIRNIKGEVIKPEELKKKSHRESWKKFIKILGHLSTVLSIMVNTNTLSEKGIFLLPETTTEEVIGHPIKSEAILPKEVEVESDQTENKDSDKKN